MNIFRNNILTIYGNYGQKWLDNLPETIEDIALKYSLSSLTPLTNLSYNYVLAGLQNGYPIILKLSIDFDASTREAEALKIFRNHGAVRLLEKGPGFLLLERIMPGTSLKEHWPDNESESIKIVAQLLNNIYQIPIPKSKIFPNIVEWLKVVDQEYNIDSAHLAKARRLKNTLTESSDDFKLLHGDLHHDNILNNQGIWQLIDPKGVIGERAFELAYFIRSPILELIKSSIVNDIILHRVHEFAPIFNLEPSRILNWCYVQAVVSQIWNLEDGLDISDFKNFTIILDNMIE